MSKVLNLFVLFVSVGYITAIPDSDPAKPQYSRFLQIPVDGTRSQLIDLEAKPDEELVNDILRFGDINRYLLFTRNNPRSAQYLDTDDLQALRASNFNASNPTLVLIHGWMGRPNQNFDRSIRDALITKSDVNVIVVGWQRVSVLDYVSAVFAVPSIGRNVGRFLEFLNRAISAPFTSMHLVGHSLGAHVAANAGREVNGRAARITGLDPAGPLWYLNPNALRPKDAIYVEAIHTNGLVLGIGREVADADFFPNGGLTQPGCLTNPCSHNRSYELFAASITYDHLVGTRCSNFLQMTLNLCKGVQFPMGNGDVHKNGTGIYRLRTGRTYPF